ncbi:hypothetical protein [Streptococcus ruminantium]|uniref:hypothetical protein n=1 Tax=Streptococcus ruminantium TaxID=1917441 RepID=UPI0012DFACFA|nr:hypothetical protein [Streptococcus ruminantium]
MCLHKIRKDIILNHPKKPEEIGIRYVSIAQFKNCLERKLVQICLFSAEDYVTVVVINIQSILIKWIKLMGIKDSKVFIVSRVDVSFLLCSWLADLTTGTSGILLVLKRYHVLKTENIIVPSYFFTLDKELS